MREKILFVITRYGLKINGGAEVHCRMLAERLAKDYDVELLATCVNNYRTYETFCKEGTENINGITVRRFKVEPFDPGIRKQKENNAKYARKIRRVLYRLNLSRVFALHPVWHFQEEAERKVLKTDGLYAPDLVEYINAHHQEFKAIIFFSYYHPTPHLINNDVYKKSILIPLAHYDSVIFRSINSQLFHKIAYIGFNSDAEQDMCEKIFRHGIAKHGIISAGVEIVPGKSYEAVKHKYQLPDNYFLYAGRIDTSKIEHLISYFLSYKKKYNDDIYLVLSGNIFMKKTDNPFIIYTGFVEESEKTTLMQNASVIINPSKHESLSLLMLEAMQLEKIVLVNGKSKVLKEHCINSDGAAFYYTNKKSFINQLHFLRTHSEALRNNAVKAKKYVEENYNWEIIMNRLKSIIETL